MNSKEEYQCELCDIRSIKNGIISINEVTQDGSKIVAKAVEEVVELIVACKSEEVFPKEIGLLKNLQLLTLGGGNFREIPSEIGALTKLNNLILINASLHRLPVEFYRIQKLTRLAIMYNMNEFEFQESLCMEQFKISVLITSTKIKSLPNYLAVRDKLMIENKEAY